MSNPSPDQGATSELKLILDQHEHVCALLEKEIEHLQQAVARVTGERNRYQDKNGALEARLDALNREREALAGDRDLLKAQHADDLNTLQATIDDLQAHQERMLEQLDAVRAEHDQLVESSAAERRSLQDRVDTHDERVETLKAAYEAKIGQLEQRQRTARRQAERGLTVARERADEIGEQLDASRRETLRVRSALLSDEIRRSATQAQGRSELLRLRLEVLRNQFSLLRHSGSWRLGNRAVRLLEIALLRWRKVLVTDHIDERFAAGSEIDWNRLDAGDGARLHQVSEGLEQDLSDLFQSKRWTVGRRLGAPWMDATARRELHALPERMIREARAFRQAVHALSDGSPSPGMLPAAAVEPGMISVIMPVYNGAGQVEQAIASVVAQSNTGWELLCIDDCSTDDSLSRLYEAADQDPRIRVLAHPENRGKSTARNTGLAHARGEYVFFLDADDWLDEQALANLLNVMEHDDVDMVNGQTFKIRDDTQERTEGIHRDYQHLEVHAQRPEEQPLLLQNAIVCNKLIRRQFLVETGAWRFNETLDRFEDTEMTMRWYLHGPSISMCRTPTYFYRQHAGDIACRSNRKPGGLEKAPLFRLHMAAAILHYRATAELWGDRVVLVRQLLLVIKSLNQVDAEFASRAWQVAVRAARALDRSDLDRLSPGIDEFFDALAREDIDGAQALLKDLRPALAEMKPADMAREDS